MNAWEEGDTIFADVMEYPVAPLFPNADGSTPQRALRAAGALDFRPRRRLRHDQARAARRPARRVPALRRAPRGPGLPARLVRRQAPRRQNDGGFDTIAHVDLQTGKRTDLCVRRRRCAGRAGFRPALRRTRRRRRVGHRGGLPRRARTAATSRCSTPPVSRPDRSAWPRCRAGFPSAFTETGVRRSPCRMKKRPAAVRAGDRLHIAKIRNCDKMVFRQERFLTSESRRASEIGAAEEGNKSTP